MIDTNIRKKYKRENWNNIKCTTNGINYVEEEKTFKENASSISKMNPKSYFESSHFQNKSNKDQLLSLINPKNIENEYNFSRISSPFINPGESNIQDNSIIYSKKTNSKRLNFDKDNNSDHILADNNATNLQDKSYIDSVQDQKISRIPFSGIEHKRSGSHQMGLQSGKNDNKRSQKKNVRMDLRTAIEPKNRGGGNPNENDSVINNDISFSSQQNGDKLRAQSQYIFFYYLKK